MNDLFYNSINKTLSKVTEFLIKVLSIKITFKYKTKKFYNLGISNHVSEFDFLLLYMVFVKHKIDYSFITDERFENYPIIKQWTHENKSIFVSRKDGNGCESIRKNTNINSNVFIFPEGTLYYKPMIKKSNKICVSNNIVKYKNVLCPKINGFNTLKEILKPEYITNITFKYIFEDKTFLKESQTPLTIYHLLKYRPKEIIIYIDRVKVDANTDINEIFREKDQLLDNIM
jgi:1-acyl-sn-glycerol-3-phosphate acyltransferase